MVFQCIFSTTPTDWVRLSSSRQDRRAGGQTAPKGRFGRRWLTFHEKIAIRRAFLAVPMDSWGLFCYSRPTQKTPPLRAFDETRPSHNEGASVQVLVRDNNVDQALKALKKKMQREGIFREMKLRGHYEKPSEKKAREKAEAIRRARKLARKKMQREGLLPAKPRVVPGAAGGPGGAGGRGGERGGRGAPRF
jgi:small subunit ribosomal protein S21